MKKDPRSEVDLVTPTEIMCNCGYARPFSTTSTQLDSAN